MPLTRRQKEVLDFLVDYVDQHGFNPSYEELAGALGLASLATVHKHVAALEAKKYIRRSFNQSRSVEVSEEYRNERRRRRNIQSSLEVPLLGKIAAGAPVEAFSSDEKLNFGDFTANAETYALQVRGDSMIDDHICSGDYVLVQSTTEVRDGDIVVALVDSMETTLKRIYREPDDMIRLQPANSDMQPILVKASSVRVQGRVLAVLRKYK